MSSSPNNPTDYPETPSVGWNKRPKVVEHVSADQPIWFISDLHIGDATPCDAFFGKDRHLIALIERVKQDNSLLVIVGDAIDFHQAWFFIRVLRAHQELFSALSELARNGRLYYVIGNHDYEINLFQEILSFRVCDELVIGDRILCVHGWQYDPYLMDALGHGHQWSTTIHHLFERYLGTWLRIPLGEFYTFGNRLMFWLAHKLALGVYAYASVMATIGRPWSAKVLQDYLDYWAQGNMGDPMAIFRPAMRDAASPEWDVVICGHSHLPGLVPSGNGLYVNTGSWTFSSSHYVVWDGKGGWTCKDWITGKSFTTEFYRLLIDGLIYQKDFWQWWRENYMGMLRFREGEERKSRLRGWESYVRDHQRLSQMNPLGFAPLPDQIAEEDIQLQDPNEP